MQPISTEVLNNIFSKAFEKSKAHPEYSDLIQNIKVYTPRMQAMIKAWHHGMFELYEPLRYRADYYISTLSLKFSLYSACLKRILVREYDIMSESDLEYCVRLAVYTMSKSAVFDTVAEVACLQITMNTALCKNSKPLPWEDDDFNVNAIDTRNIRK